MNISKARKLLASQNSGWPVDHMVMIPRDQWPVMQNPGMIKVFRSRHFLAQVFEEAGGMVRLSVCRTALKFDGHWDDNISWNDLQWVKFQCDFAEQDAVEVFPAETDIVNISNMRHLWVFPQPLDFVWRKSIGEKMANSTVGRRMDTGIND